MTSTADLTDVAELKELLRAGACRVVDCRCNLFDADKGRDDYLGGHIPGAVHADMDKDLASEVTSDSGRHPLPEFGTFQSRLESWGIGNDTQVVAYDYGNGSLAVRFWWMLRLWLGHDRVSVLNGGIAAWTAAAGELESGVVEHPRQQFSATPDPSVVATTDEIAEGLEGAAGINLIDAREAARYRGEMEPIDTKAGHVPGARNMPLSGNLDDAGWWRGRDELAAIWRDFRDGHDEETPIVMCGSGVTACHLILSARLAGLPAPRLYVGSWSEWIRDESRPIATSE